MAKKWTKRLVPDAESCCTIVKWRIQMTITTLINKGRFQKGDGRPKGRPKGVPNKITALIRGACPEILEVVIEQAKAGDLQAAAIILSRGVAPIKASHEPVAILTAAALASMTPAQRADAVTTAALAGKLPADVAAALLDGIAKGCAIFEASELLARVEQLEQLADAEERGVQRV